MPELKDKFIKQVAFELQNTGYLVETDVSTAGVRALLAARTQKPVRLGFAKVDDYFVFVDWENAAFSRIDLLISLYYQFNNSVNRKYKVPRGLRMHIPNMVLAAVSESEFSQEEIRYVRSAKFVPWIGGECGQLMLICLKDQSLIHYKIGRYRETGALPLGHAAEGLNRIIIKSFSGLAAGAEFPDS